MTDRLLFYIESYFIHFGIAKSLQEKHDCKLYSILDFDTKGRKFFDSQNLVSFTKSWDYLENTSNFNKNPDIEYLKSFEKKYGIDIWKIAYTEKHFYKYNKNYKFSQNEILSLIEQECKFFERVIEESKPDFLVMLVPLSHYQELLYQICKSLKIKILILLTPKFANRLLISENPVVVDNKNTNDLPKMTDEELSNYMNRFDMYKQLNQVKKTAFESNKAERYKSIIKYFVSQTDQDYKKRYSNFGISHSKVLKNKISRSIKRKSRESFINNNFKKTVDTSKSFIYFPLHYEPERILLIDAPFYDNQIAVITSIAKSIPVEFTLVLKEHPFMKTLGWRPLSFYKELMDLPNVEILHPSVSPPEIMKNCSLIITIAGTAGLEAAFFQKPTILLSDQLYSDTPFTYRLEKLEDLPKTIRTALNTPISLNDVGKFVQMMDNNTFALSFFKLTNDFAYRFGFKGPLVDAELPDSKVKQFLDDHKKEFDLLADEHIKKINFHKSKK